MVQVLLRDLFPFVAALYLIDCLAYADRSQQLFCSWFDHRYSRFAGRPRLAAPLPLDRLFTVSHLPLVASGEAIFLPAARQMGGAAPYREEQWTALPFAQIAAVASEEKEVRLGAAGRLKCASAAEAEELAAFLGGLLALDPGERERRIAAHGELCLDLERLRARRTAFEREVAPLLAASCLLFGLVFFALPLAIYPALSPPWLAPLAASAVILLWAVTLGAAVRIARRLRAQQVARSEGALLAIGFSLPSAMRAVVHLGRGLMRGFDPLVVAAALLPRARLIPLLRSGLHGASFAASHGASAGWRRYWSERRRVLGVLLAQLDLREQDVLSPPPPRTLPAGGYCPFCDSEFLPGLETCADCGTPLLPPAAGASS
ncbi:MAG TPA: hypothetical protein VHR45_07565 [Thermoanaerobaculia bacterium]|nr:hypothetical protein [Thermoanaerobaculia bacterium]